MDKQDFQRLIDVLEANLKLSLIIATTTALTAGVQKKEFDDLASEALEQAAREVDQYRAKWVKD